MVCEFNERAISNLPVKRSVVGSGPPADAVQDKNALIYAKLKQIYRAAVLPVEKRYRYDYFYESPFMSDVEFDGELDSVKQVKIIG